MTILLLVSFVLFILTILLLELFEGFHAQEVEKAMLQTASKISIIVDEQDDPYFISQMAEQVKEPSNKVIIYFPDDTIWISNTTNEALSHINQDTIESDKALYDVVLDGRPYNEKIEIDENLEARVIGIPTRGHKGAIYVYQTLDIINQTRAETTKIIFVAAAIAILLTTVFAFFLSTRITKPLIEMRKAAIALTKGEFNRKVPILTNDEIGELAVAFNHMGSQLNYHIDALHQEKEQLSSIVNSMADGVITLNSEGHIILMNPPAENFLNDCYYENEKDVPKDRQYELPEQIEAVYHAVLKEEKEVLKELTIQGKNWVMIFTPLYGDQNIRGAVAVLRDMTEERQLDKLRKDFIANVSHELRTPIAMMQGYSEAIVDDIAESKEDKNELAQIILDESLRMGRLVNELLDIGRMEAGQIELHFSEIELNNYVQKIITKFQGLASDKEIQLQFKADFNDLEAEIDGDRIEQVFTNLIANAIEHTPEGGQVTIEFEALQDHFVAHIKDTGVGISEDDLSFIFERFYKADKARTRNGKRKGTGLGLSIAKHIVDAHKGTITAKSKIGEGTTFSFKIPLKQ
ncbi:MAG TPA: ATP-binding protein [Sporosarcina sp.]|nr:ATP-binding protein [Sporosarcina sp.]